MYKKANYTIIKLYRKFITNGISKVQEISRKVNWDLDEKRRFLESVLNGAYIQPIILDKTNNEYTLIDGTERCLAISQFIGDMYDVNGVVFSKMEEGDKNTFLNSSVDIVVYKDLSVKERIELYKSYNKGNLEDFDLFNLSCPWDDMIVTNTILSQSLFKNELPSLDINPLDILIKTYILIEDDESKLNINNIKDFMKKQRKSISKKVSIHKLIKSISLLNEVISIDNLFIRNIDNIENMLPILLVYIYNNIDNGNIDINAILINEKLNNDINSLNVLMQNFSKADMSLQYQIMGDIIS